MHGSYTQCSIPEHRGSGARAINVRVVCKRIVLVHTHYSSQHHSTFCVCVVLLFYSSGERDLETLLCQRDNSSKQKQLISPIQLPAVVVPSKDNSLTLR